MSTSTTTSKIGAVLDAIWACLHFVATYSVYVLGRSLDSSMVHWTSIPRCMEPPVLFDHCHFGGCDVELEEQRLGLLDQLCYSRHRGHRFYLLHSCSRLCTRLAWRSGPGILGVKFSYDFLDNRSTDENQRRCLRSLRGDNLELKHALPLRVGYRVDHTR